MPMTPRERWLALFNREKPDRIPTDFSATVEVHERLRKDHGCADPDEMFKKLHVDGTQNVGPVRTVHHHPDDPDADIWGLRYRTIEYATGKYS